MFQTGTLVGQFGLESSSRYVVDFALSHRQFLDVRDDVTPSPAHIPPPPRPSATGAMKG